MKLFQFNKYLIILLLAFPIDGFSESNEDKKRLSFIEISGGLNYSSFRDFATSPLFYSGFPIYTALSHVEMDQKRASEISFAYSFGNFDTDFNNQFTVSRVNIFAINYLELFQLKSLSSSKLNLKVGGQFTSTGILRNNEDLFNNGTGFDLISTLFGSFRASIDLSRKEDREIDLLFFKYTAVKRVRDLSFTMNIGLINSSYRNGFAYLTSEAPIGGANFFSDYELNIFRGFRLNTGLDYTVFLKNGNAVQISYLWDAFRTGGHHDNFQMATHTLNFSLLYSLR